MRDYHKIIAAAEGVDCQNNYTPELIDAIIDAHEDWQTGSMPDNYSKEILAEFETVGYEIVNPYWTGVRTKDGIEITSKLIRWRLL